MTWLRLGQVLVVLTLPLMVLVQVLNHDWFPPEVSISQYGVGRWGVLFSLWVTSLAVSTVCVERALPFDARLIRWLLWIGVIGTLVMAVVRTDAGGAQQSFNAKVHMFGSILSLGFLPVGILALLRRLGRGWGTAGAVLLGVIAVSLLLLIGAAFGYDTAGLGPHESWAWWQTVAILADELLVMTLALGAGRWLRVQSSDDSAAAAGNGQAQSAQSGSGR